MMITPVIIHTIQNTRPRADLGDRSPYLWGKTRLLRARKRQYILKRQLRLSFSKSALAENDCLPDCCHGYQGPPEAFPRSSKKWRRKFSRVTGVVLAKAEYHNSTRINSIGVNLRQTSAVNATKILPHVPAEKGRDIKRRYRKRHRIETKCKSMRRIQNISLPSPTQRCSL